MGCRGIGLLLVFGMGLLTLVGPANADATPANDNFANAQVVGPGIPVSVAASNVAATAEDDEEPHFSVNPVVHSVWFRWQSGASSSRVVIDTCERGGGLDSTSSANLAVYTGTTLTGLTSVASTAGNDCLYRFTTAANTDYRIAVDFWQSEGTFQFKLRELTPPINDDFADAQEVGQTGLPVIVPATTVDSTWEANEPALLGLPDQARSIWFSWTPSVSEQVRIHTCAFARVSGSNNKTIAVYTGSTLPGLTEIASATSNCTLTFNAVAGTAYRIAFSGQYMGEMVLTFRIDSTQPPSNDSFASAEEVGPGLPTSADGNNDFATTQSGEPGHSGLSPPFRSVWFKWTPTQSGIVRINACSPSFEARLGVYTGSSVNALTSVTEDPGYAPFCHINLNATAGTPYSIAVGGNSTDNGGGRFTLSLHTLNPPANDSFADALVLDSALPFALPATNRDAGKEPGESAHGESFNSAQASVWFRWLAPRSTPILIDVCDAEFAPVLAAYTGSSILALTPVAGEHVECAGPGTQPSQFRFQAVAGQTYRIVVDSQDPGQEGSFTLRLTDLNPPEPKGPVITLPIPNGPQSQSSKKARELRQCRQVKNRMKRARCIKQVNLKFARKNCKRLGNKRKRARCLKKAKRKAGLTFCRKAYPKRAKKVRARCIVRVKRAATRA